MLAPAMDRGLLLGYLRATYYHMDVFTHRRHRPRRGFVYSPTHMLCFQNYFINVIIFFLIQSCY